MYFYMYIDISAPPPRLCPWSTCSQASAGTRSTPARREGSTTVVHELILIQAIRRIHIVHVWFFNPDLKSSAHRHQAGRQPRACIIEDSAFLYVCAPTLCVCLMFMCLYMCAMSVWRMHGRTLEGSECSPEAQISHRYTSLRAPWVNLLIADQQG